MIRPLYSLLFAVVLLAHLLPAQRRTDSLLLVLASQPADTNRVITLTELAKQFRNTNPDTAIILGNEALKLAVRLRYMKGMGKASHYTGAAYYVQGKYNEALEHFNRALVAWRLLAPPHGGASAATALGNIGLVYSDLGNYPLALEHFLQVLAISEKTGEKQLYTGTLANIGLIYYYQGNEEEALHYYRWALKENEHQLQSQEPGAVKAATTRIAVLIGNIGNVMYERGQLDSAYAHYLRSLDMRKKLRLQNLVANTLSNLGTVCLDKLRTADKAARDSLLNLAAQYYSEAHEIYETIGDRGGLATNHIDLANLFLNTGRHTQALQHYKAGLNEALEVGAKLSVMSAYAGLARIDSITGDHKSALAHYKLFVQYSDSLNNEENTKRTVEAEMQYEFDKKEAATRLEQEKKDAVAAAEVKRQKIVLYAISGFGLLILAFAVFAYRSFLQKRRANVEITRQKTIIEEKQHAILDSIRYARRIQHSLLPNDTYIQKNLKRLQNSC